MKRIAIVGAVLENPGVCQHRFNDTVAEFRNIIKGRMGTPFDNEDITVVAITVIGELDEINALTGRLGSLPNVTVKTAISSTDLG
ncbi:MAG: iron-only hydrogenase system regulator [Spirochaetaceae bacterium]|jgi:putative iron-only hydrogenase system regulator|nr:iron-only hydrogenase system regulator [Spirochaetaceae bacterium]GMO21229.1 MAG: iron-only hydrogenase system regulator [Termitinemataceae bacterium]